MGRSKRIEWQYVEKIKALRKGQWTCKCNFCGHVWGGGPHRIRSHLLSLPGQGVGPCDSVTEDVKDIVRRLHADASSDGKDSREAIDALVDDLGRSASQSQGDASLSTHGEGSTHASGSSKSNVNSSKKRKVAQGAGGLPAAFGLQARKQADQALRRFFYAEDVPEWKVRSPYFLDMIKAIGNVGPSYVPPSYHALRTTELNDETRYAKNLGKVVYEGHEKYLTIGHPKRSRRGLPGVPTLSRPRKDLEELGVKNTCWVQDDQEIPDASWILTKEEEEILKKTIGAIRTPTGTVHSLKNAFTSDDKELTGLKSHDCSYFP
ncbi:hypothetical protein L7F22_066903 [Adiantum nelumboides]|nr:hypothetical protein [Adiantum nelumboides]